MTQVSFVPIINPNQGINNYEFTLDNIPVTEAVPEPTTLAIWSLFGVCSAAVAARRGKRRDWAGGDRQAISSLVGRGRA